MVDIRVTRVFQSLGHWMALLLLAIVCHEAGAQIDERRCGPLKSGPGQYGPFDFRTDKEHLGVVENRHFPPGTEDLLFKYDTYKNPPPGNYTLMAYPNHPRALMLLMNLGEKFRTDMVPGYPLPVECYFERATRFAPDDVVVRLIYSIFLTKKARETDALAQLEYATTKAGDNPFSHFNIGMMYFELKQYPKALVQAHRAMALGLPKQELKERLRSVNAWSDPAAPQTPSK